MPPFVADGDPNAAAVAALGLTLLWLAALYQLFDGLNIGASFCLRGTGDVRFPAGMVFVLSWVLFVPLAHALAFAPGEGWVGFLPQFGLGVAGTWAAAIGHARGSSGPAKRESGAKTEPRIAPTSRYTCRRRFPLAAR